MSTEIALYGIKDMQVMADAIAKSGLFGMKSHDQALALMLVAQSEGQHPATITQEYDIIQGKACRKTHSVMARFQQMNGRVEWHQLTDVIADATFSHPAGGSLRIAWTFDQAKKAGLTGKDNWKNYPRAMLRARVIAEGIRAVYPAAIGGMLIAEEAQDLQPVGERTQTEKDITAEGETLKPEPKAPEPWTAEDFSSAIKKYGPTVKAGTKTAEALITWMKARNPLTAEQEASVLALTPAPIEGEVLAPEDQSEFGVLSEAEMAAARARELAEAGQ